MRKLFLLCIIGCFMTKMWAQEKKFDVSLHGFVGVNAAYNSRESMEVRNRQIYLYPLPENMQNGVDLNDEGTFDIDAALTRLSVHVKGPTINDVSVSAVMEGDFLGASGNDNIIRLRQAYVQFDYKELEILAGQTWHPFFMPDYYPRTINANVGAPIHPLCRNPQLRLTHSLSPNFKWSLMFIEQNNFRSLGFPDGSEKSGLPEIDLQLHLGSNNFRAALTAGYKRLAIPSPDSVIWTTRPTVDALHFQANFLITLPKATIRTGAIYGDNLTEQIMPGGVGVLTSTLSDNIPSYKSLSVVSTWMDINSNYPKWDPGFFMGYLSNLGANEKVTILKEFTRDANLANLWVVSPRLRYNVTPYCWVALEYSYTEAGWGTLAYSDKGLATENSFDSYGKTQSIKNYHNHRTLLSVRYTF